MPLFEVAIITVLSDDERKRGDHEELIMPPTAVVARDSQTAVVAAMTKYKGNNLNPNRVQVLVRPFV